MRLAELTRCITTDLDCAAKADEVVITATYRDTACRILQHAPTESRILLLTDDPETARELNAQEADIGVFEATVPTAELFDIAGQSRHAGRVAASTS